MQNRDEYLKTIGIQQWKRRGEETDEPAWNCQGPIETAAFAFILQPQNLVALDWELPELQLLANVIQAVGLSPEQALLLWPLQHEIQTAAPKLPQSCCCVIFGEALASHVEHTKKIITVPLEQLMQDNNAKRTLWQALKATKNHG